MRLRKLTLFGFKSFADKTEISFDHDIIGIVGPNGCGKSNVVDAIKWVLGEQSAKSLRGGEMKDVIFNGSAQRSQAGMASVMLTFDNPVVPELLAEAAAAGEGGRPPRRLPLDADTVEVTRQLFRDGTSDYLLNGQRARLRDIKEVFLDTGVATDAYSVIEQGKVARMLEANPRERRVIFEEAAGISRFKVRKREAQRKLEKTDQNLTLSRNRLEDTERRLRSAKMQAARARAYLEYRESLKELQLKFGLAEYHHLHGELSGLRTDLETAQNARIEASVALTACEQELNEVEARFGEENAVAQQADAERHSWQSRMEQARQRTAFALQQSGEVRLSAARDAQRAQEVEVLIARHAEELESGRARLEEIHAQLAEAEGRLSESREVAQMAQEEAATARNRLEDAARNVQKAHREATGHEAEARSLAKYEESLRLNLEGLEARLAELNARLAVQQAEAQRLADEQAIAAAQLADGEARLAEEKTRLSTLGGRQSELSALLAAARDERATLSARARALSEMNARHEGVGEAVKAVLAANHPFIKGLLVEQLDADAADASLIEAALGDYQQALVVEHLSDVYAADFGVLSGRAAFVAVAGREILAAPAMLETLAVRVRCAEWLRPLVDRLLGRTILVRDLESAAMASAVLPTGFRFVTAKGELLEADGRIVVGGLNAGTGLISRRTELAELQAALATVEAAIMRDEAELAGVSAAAGAAEQARAEAQKQSYEARTQMARLSAARDAVIAGITRLEKEAPGIVAEAKGAAAKLEDATLRRTSHETSAAEALAAAEAGQAQVDEMDALIRELAERADMARETMTVARVEVGKLSEAAQGAERSLRVHEHNAADLHRQSERLSAQSAAATARLAELDAASQEANAEAEEADSRLQEALTRADMLRQRVEETQETVGALRGKARAARNASTQAESAAHKLELRVRELEVKSNAVCERVQEQLEINLIARYTDIIAARAAKFNPLPIVDPVAAAAGMEFVDSDAVDAEGAMQPAPQAAAVAVAVPEVAEEFLGESDPFVLDMAATHDEMEHLKGKIMRLGNVNLEAIDEEQTLETAHVDLEAQVKDIEEAKLALEGLIEQINKDSRERFDKTFKEIQEHFTGNDGMFRRIFGGGKAELKLVPPEETDENGEKVPAINPDGTFDVLEAGIEIVAMPPGKKPAALSQLSGGEKTMTALGLLMAIFRTRPSPYAILDEVDAALDEANVARYINILRSFCDKSHFIVITHRKPTMQGCDALYGITQQIRGVSTHVKVRVEDIRAENGDVAVVASHPIRDVQAAPPFTEPEAMEPKPAEPAKRRKSKAMAALEAAAAQSEAVVTVAPIVSMVAEALTPGNAGILAGAEPMLPSEFPPASEAAPTAETIQAEAAAPAAAQAQTILPAAPDAEPASAPTVIIAAAKDPESNATPGFPDLSIKPVSANRQKLAGWLLGKRAEGKV